MLFINVNSSKTVTLLELSVLIPEGTTEPALVKMTHLERLRTVKDSKIICKTLKIIINLYLIEIVIFKVNLYDKF